MLPGKFSLHHFRMVGYAQINYYEFIYKFTSIHAISPAHSVSKSDIFCRKTCSSFSRCQRGGATITSLSVCILQNSLVDKLLTLFILQIKIIKCYRISLVSFLTENVHSSTLERVCMLKLKTAARDVGRAPQVGKHTVYFTITSLPSSWISRSNVLQNVTFPPLK